MSLKSESLFRSSKEDKKNCINEANDAWNILLDNEEPDESKRSNMAVLETILDISNIQPPPQDNSGKDEEDVIREESLDDNFVLEQQSKLTVQAICKEFQKDVEDEFTIDAAQRGSNQSKANGNHYQIIENAPPSPQKLYGALSPQLMYLSPLQQNRGSYNTSNQLSPQLPTLQNARKSSSYKEHGYMSILKNQKNYFMLEQKVTNVIQNESESNIIQLPSTKQNLNQNVHSFDVGIDELTNLNDETQRRNLFETMKSFLDIEQKVQVITNFDDLSYSSTGIQFNIASYREGEKGMQVIVCHNIEMENKVNYIIDEQSSLTEFCDLQLLEKITYIIDQKQEEISYYLKKLIVIVTEKPKTSFKRFLKGKLENPKLFKEEQFRGCIRKLIRNVLFRHDSCIASRGLNPHKISCLFEHRIVVSDLGESIVDRNLNLRDGDTFMFENQEYNELLTNYSSPEEKRILTEDSFTFYDPYKSEIYSLGKIILEICLIKYQNYFVKKYSNKTTQDGSSNSAQMKESQSVKEWIQSILKDQDLSYQLAGDLIDVINEIVLGKVNTQYFFKKGLLKKLRIPNVLQQMLEPKEEDRISSIKLALLTQSEKLLIRNRIQDPYPIFFKGQINPDGYQIKYPIRKLIYEGEIDLNYGEKHRKGLIRRQLDSEQESRLMVEYGQFNKGRVNGEVRMFIFQDHWKLEGQCYNNSIHGHNTILYQGQEVFKGYFSNFILNEWYDVDNTDTVLQNIKADKEMKFQIENDIEIFVNNTENLIKCYNDKSFDSLIEFSSLYESTSLLTFKKIELYNCGSPIKLEKILQNIPTFTKLKIENTYVNINTLLQSQQKLQQIDITNSQYLTDEDLISLVSNQNIQQQLKKLCLDSNSKITVKGVRELANQIVSMPKLQYLSCKKLCSNQQTDKVKLDELSQVFINLLTNSFHILFLLLDHTPIKDVIIQKVFENKKQTPIKWQFLSLNHCDGITKDGLRDLFGCKQLTELKKLDLMYCNNPKFDLPSKNLKSCPQILNIAYSASASGNQLEKFVSRNTVVSSTLQQISMNVNVLDSKARDGLKKLTNPLTLILCIKEISKIPNMDLCLDILASFKNAALYMASDKPVIQNEVNLAFSQSSKSQYTKKIKFNKWKDGEFLSDPNPQVPEQQQSQSITQQSIQEILEEDEINLEKEAGPFKKKNKNGEYNKDALKLLGFFNYKQEETIYTIRIMTRIFNNANLQQVTHLDLSSIDLDLKSLLILTYTPHVKNIAILDISSQHITDQIIQDFTLSPYFTSLKTIILKKNNITIKAINLLLQADNLALENIITDKQSLSEDDLYNISNENLTIFKMKIFGFFKNIESTYSSPAEVRDSSNSLKICQISIFNNNSDKYLYLIEGVKRDTKLGLFTIKKIDNSFADTLYLSYCGRVLECMQKSTNNLTLNFNDLNNKNLPAKQFFITNFGLLSSIRILKLVFTKTKSINDLIISTIQSLKQFQSLCDLVIDLSQTSLALNELEQISGNIKNLTKLEIFNFQYNQVTSLKQNEWKFLQTLGESTKALLNLQEAYFSFTSCQNLTSENINDMLKKMTYLKIQKLQLNLKQNSFTQEEEQCLQQQKASNFIICDFYIHV